MAGRAAVFLDRDGTVIVDREYLGDPAGVSLIPGAAAAIRRLNEAGLPVVLVTNQSGIGRGYYDAGDFEVVQARLAQLLASGGARLDATYYCPHAPDRDPPCDCRKPAVGLFERAAADHGLDLSRSFYIGDRVRDVAPALHFGGTGILVGPSGVNYPGEEAPPGVVVLPDLPAAASHVLGRPSD